MPKQQTQPNPGPAATGLATGGSTIPLPAKGFAPASTKATAGVKAQVHAFVQAAWAQYVKAQGGLGSPCTYTGGLVCAHNVPLVNSLRQAWYGHLQAHGVSKAACSQYTGYCTQSGAMHTIRNAQGGKATAKPTK